MFVSLLMKEKLENKVVPLLTKTKGKNIKINLLWFVEKVIGVMKKVYKRIPKYS